MNPVSDTAAQAAIGSAARELRLPTVRAQAARLAEIAGRVLRELAKQPAHPPGRGPAESGAPPRDILRPGRCPTRPAGRSLRCSCSVAWTGSGRAPVGQARVREAGAHARIAGPGGR